jgi:DNA-binding Lrp family transcriptional regulator
MVIAFVLITTIPSMEHEVYRDLQEVDEIVELHPIFGEYDLLAKIEVPDVDELSDVMLKKIRRISGILNTKTMTSVPFN